VFVTQRVCPSLALVTPRLSPTSLLVDAPSMPTLLVELKSKLHVERIQQMRKQLGFAQPPAVERKLAEEGERAEAKSRRTVTIWSDQVTAIDEGNEAAAWFTKYLGRPVRLVRVPDDNSRHVSQKYMVDGATNTVAFGDGFPFLLASRGSLEALNQELPEPLPMNRFRPNIVVASTKPGGDVPFVEDTWGLIQIGSHKMHAVKHCTRCKLTTVDQALPLARRAHIPSLTRQGWPGQGSLFR